MAGTKLTPMMAQYQSMRRSLPADVLLLFRLGDFYEMFFEDAQTAAPILNVALTRRNSVPMCGVPYHAADNYISKLVKAGKRVAIAEQTTEPQPGKIVEREIARIISAGSIIEHHLLDDARPNFLAAVFQFGKKFGLACVDHTTGSFTLTEFDSRGPLDDELARLTPSELLVSDEQLEAFGALPASQAYDAFAFLPDPAGQLLKDHFGVHSLHGFGCAEMPAAIGAAGAVLHYLVHQLRRPCEHLRSLKVREDDGIVLIDAASQRNLDLVDSRSGRKHTLLGVLDRTKTPMGARLLRDWILHPLRDREALLARQEMIAAFLAEPFILSKVRESLQGIRDIERTTSRLSQGAGNARDLQALATSLSHIPTLKEDLLSLPMGSGVGGQGAAAGGQGSVAGGQNSENGPRDPSRAPEPEQGPRGSDRAPEPQSPTSHSSLVTSHSAKLHDFTSLTELLATSLSEEPPATLKDGGLIADGHSAELDELRAAGRDGKKWIAQLQEDERKRTGIDSLKVKFNNVFGYFIEISAAKLATATIPDDYTRKQTMANAERFITPALKEMESKVLGSEERAKQLEHELFLELRQQVCTHLDALQETAAAVAEIDVLGGLADVAQTHRHSRPVLEESRYLEITNGRHPVLEQTLVDEKFVPNDTEFVPPPDSGSGDEGSVVSGQNPENGPPASAGPGAQEVGTSAPARPAAEPQSPPTTDHSPLTTGPESPDGPADLSLVQILTGPNMAGKSTYIRQVALITLMAQIGAYVPAESATVGLVDRIFCRVGASDDLSRGQSTFMVEMNETALILNHATDRSLVILDEIGRGTATFDGLSIAWAVAEHLHDVTRCRTLFATHYHELTDLTETRAAVANYNVAVREWNDEIIFLRKIVPGAADKSYGIQVARLAGLPTPIIDRAKDILSHLEMHSAKPDAKKRGPKAKNTRPKDMPDPNPPQLDLFD
ncbi:DNA mismatch repair protein mutS [Haloferula helveola]|uniref:DNA mismatch repair protein MutS n=1 Tax=Haloferula helveola TaxID=490095 RepID=A0ABM7R9W2_9BACT|nr:DNA mismatch repair protein mutS [Haloferula helveola]